MGIRLSGISSGLDTDSIVKELMAAHSMKKVKIEQKKSKLEWKAEKWKDLNTKLVALYRNRLSDLRLQGTYQTKKASSSDESKVTVKAANSSAVGSHSLQVTKLASSQYITGAALKDETGKVVAGSTHMTQLGFNAGDNIRVTTGTGENQVITNIEITESMTLSSFTSDLQKAGLNATYDTNQGRFFISSKKSGTDSVFSIEMTDTSTYNTAKDDLIEKLQDFGYTAEDIDLFFKDYDEAISLARLDGSDESWANEAKLDLIKSDFGQKFLSAAAQREIESRFTAEARAEFDAEYYDEVNGHDYFGVKWNAGKWDSAEQTLIDRSDETDYEPTDEEINTYLMSQYHENMQSVLSLRIPQYLQSEEGKNEIKDLAFIYDKEIQFYPSVKSGATNFFYEDGDVSKGFKPHLVDATRGYLESLGGGTVTDEEVYARLKQQYDDALEQDMSACMESTGLVSSDYNANIEDIAERYNGAREISMALDNYVEARRAINNNATAVIDPAGNPLNNLGFGNISIIQEGTGEMGEDGEEIMKSVAVAGNATSVKQAANSQIILDGAVLDGDSNDFVVAGLTLELKDLTAAGEVIRIGVSNDTTAVVDNIKTFVKEYNQILQEMNDLYFASTAKGYEPLTDEEKANMSEGQIKMWEDKIKDSLLRRDSTLSSVIRTFRSITTDGVEVNGKKYTLSSFGICGSDYTERGLLHIYGDPTDAVYSNKKDLLTKLFTENPDEAAEAFSKLVKNVYDTLQKQMSTDANSTNLKSPFSFYHDKSMKKQVETYEKSIKEWETKLTKMENKYYKQFTAMEKAMASLNSQSDYLAGVLSGLGNNK